METFPATIHEKEQATTTTQPPAPAETDPPNTPPTATTIVVRKRPRGGAPTRSSYSYFTKVSLVKRFQSQTAHKSGLKSYARFLQTLTQPEELVAVGLDDMSQIPPAKTFRKWLVDEAILQGVASNTVTHPHAKRHRKCHFPLIESALRQHMQETGETSVKELRSKAMEFAATHLPPGTPFSASNGWMQKVLERKQATQLELSVELNLSQSARAHQGGTATDDGQASLVPPTYDQAMDCVIQLSNYADHVGSKHLINAVAQVSLAMAKIQHAKQQQRQQQQKQHQESNESSTSYRL
jgi:hypothetical protein